MTGEPIKILLVEDNPDHAELILRSFDIEQEQFSVEVIDSIVEAKRITEICPPRLVLTDFRLPDGEGSDLVVAAAGRWPVLIMTSQGSERLAVEVMKIGAQDYIVKSLETFRDMSRTVSFALKTWSLVVSRRQSDDAVLRAKRDWERTFDAVPDMISIIDTEHNITRVNRAMAARCGLTMAEIVGRKCYDVVHRTDCTPSCCPGISSLRDGAVHSTEVEEKSLNGHFAVTVSPLTDELGRVTSYVHVMRDITGQKKSEELVRQRAKLREIALNSSVDELMQATLDACEQLTDSTIGFFHLVDDDQMNLTLQAWSTNTIATMCTAEGHGSHYPISKAGVWVECFYTREPVIHNDYPALLHRKGLPPGHAPVIRELTVPVVLNDKVVSIIGVGNKNTPYDDHDVHVVKQFVVFASEVIGRKKAVIALRESEERHRQLANEQRVILNASPMGISLLKNRTVLWTNPAFDQIFGYMAGEAMGVQTEVFYCDRETYEQVGKDGYSAITAGLVYSSDVRMKRHDGSMFWCNLVGQAVNPDNSEEGSIWVVMDISDRKRAEEERLHLEQQFQQTQKLESLGVLAGGIAHDFNNILTVILGHCYMVNEECDSGLSDKAHIQHIQAAGNRAADLCRQMLAYAGNSPQHNTQVNLFLLVDEIVKMLKSAIKKNVDIQLDLKRDVPDISADNAQIQQVVMNLIINAAEAIGGNNGLIRIALRKQIISVGTADTDFMGNAIKAGSYACIEVSDNGCGMDEEVQKRIFEPFFTTKFTGRGLGMSAILGIIKSHEGALQLTSVPGSGTSFRVYFPVPVKVEYQETESLPGSDPSATVSGRILLVDDEQALLSIGTAILSSMGFTVETACNGREALERYNDIGAEINLVMLDLVMPEMGGLEAYHRLRLLNPGLPVVICSGYGADELLDALDRDVKLGRIQKPYTPDLLRSTLLGLMAAD